MKKRIIITMLMCFLVGCTQNESTENTLESTIESTVCTTEESVEESSETKESVTKEEETSVSVNTSIEDGELTTLVYGYNQNSKIDQATVDAINQYLKDHNCSYQVRFVNLQEDFHTPTDEYVQYVKDYMDKGNALDICYLSSLNDFRYITSYEIFIEEGYLEDLTPYLDSELGKALKASMPEEKFNSLVIDGKMYGLNGYPYSAQPSIAYVVSKDLMKKYELTEEDLQKSPSDLADLLAMIQEEEEQENEKFICVNYTKNFTGLNFPYLYAVNGYISGICLDEKEEENPLIYTLDDEEYLAFLREMYEISSDERIKTTLEQPKYENHFLTVYAEGLFSKGFMNYCESVDDYRYITVDDFEIIYPYGKTMRIRDSISANSIMKSSKHKEEAFDFLARMYSDPELSNLVQYGAGYELKDGYAYMLKNGEEVIANQTIVSWRRGNGFISASLACETVNKKEELFELYDTYGYVSPYAGFKFDRSNYQELVTDTNKVMEKLSKVVSGNVEDFDEAIKELRKEFMEAGGEELYNAVKEQWDAFLENKK